VTNERDKTEPIAEVSSAFTPEGATSGERAPWLTPYRWTPGQSGNPSGRPRESGSLAAALRRVGVKPAKTRAELTKLAVQLGMDPEEAQNIDVVAGLIYDGITQLLIRTVEGKVSRPSFGFGWGDIPEPGDRRPPTRRGGATRYEAGALFILEADGVTAEVLVGPR